MNKLLSEKKAVSNWISFEKEKPPDGEGILLGQYYIDTYNGEYGDDRWIWITQGEFEEGTFHDCFNDEETLAEHMVAARRPTHWSQLPKRPILGCVR